MRVIAGSAKSIPLQTVRGSKTRPTTDRIKETLFNIISTDVNGARFLDMFAGSGQIGIEALSRGASEVVFVDSDRDSYRCILDNLNKVRLRDKATVCCRDVFSFLERLHDSEPFDIIFIDPPYDMDDQEKILKEICDAGILSEDGYIILEASAQRDFDIDAVRPFSCIRIKDYKTNRHLFFTLS